MTTWLSHTHRSSGGAHESRPGNHRRCPARNRGSERHTTALRHRRRPGRPGAPGPRIPGDVVDLPGFGDSDVADENYSGAVAAEDLHALIGHLSVGAMHVVGQDVSGGVIYRMSHMAAPGTSA